MAKSITDIVTTLRKAGNYFLTSEYSIVWSGKNASRLNEWNEHIEAITIPGKTIQTSDSRTANSLIRKIATDITFEDMEITWRLDEKLTPYRIIEDWQSQAKNYNLAGTMTTGYWDDYCLGNYCVIKLGSRDIPSVIVRGLYPTNLQSIQMAAEGGEYVKFSCTFSCFLTEYGVQAV